MISAFGRQVGLTSPPFNNRTRTLGGVLESKDMIARAMVPWLNDPPCVGTTVQITVSQILGLHLVADIHGTLWSFSNHLLHSP